MKVKDIKKNIILKEMLEYYELDDHSDFNFDFIKN